MGHVAILYKMVRKDSPMINWQVIKEKNIKETSYIGTKGGKARGIN